MTRILLALPLALTCVACDTKEKLDTALDEGTGAARDARATMKNVNAKLDKLDAILTKLGDAAGGSAGGTKATAAAAAISNTGAKGGNVQAQGGTPQTASEPQDVDGDGQADDVTTVTYDTSILWLIPVANAQESFCGSASTVNFVVTDKPPTQVLSFGQYDPACGTVACPGEPTETYDFETQCGCQDTAGADISCDAFASEEQGGDGGGQGGQGEGGGGEGGQGEGGVEDPGEEGEGGVEDPGEEGEAGEEGGELTCDDIAAECETACADAEDDEEFELCADDCLAEAGC